MVPDNSQTPKREKRSFSSLRNQLNRQIKFLENSCALFDNGDEDEAVRLATTIRVLLHDTNKSKSLLKQLGIKDSLPFIDTGVYPDRLIEAQNQYFASLGFLEGNYKVASYAVHEVGLLSLNSSNDKWVAPLSTSKIHPSSPFFSAIQSPQKFSFWWETPLIQGDSNIISRRELIGIMSDQDGGAHVDPSLDILYSDLTLNDNGLQWATGENMPEPTMTSWYDQPLESAKSNIAAASVRQIAYEVLETLNKYVSNESLNIH
jgi:hypothetical protein